MIETYRPYKGEIAIRIAGIHTKELLSVITNEIDEINNSFEKIRVTKLVPCICEECQEDNKPHFFRMKVLDRYLEKRRYEIPCDKSCLDVQVRRLTAVLSDYNRFDELDQQLLYPERFSPDKKLDQERFEQLKKQHVELHPDASKNHHINAENVQIVENTSGGNVRVTE